MIRIISTKINGRLISALAEDFDIKEFKISENTEEEVSFNIGDIIVGRVENIVKNINACFVEIFPGIQAYLPLTTDMKIIYANGKPGGTPVVNDLILVQVAKLPTKTKSYSLTTDFTFIGKYAVLKPGMDRVYLSSKFREEDNFAEIKARFMLLGEKFVRETGSGAIIRKAANGLSDKELEDALYDLCVKFVSIINRGRHGVKYERIFKEIPEYLSLIRDNCANIEKIMTDDEETYREYEAYLKEFSENDLKKLFFYKDDMMSLSALYSINTTLEKTLGKRVWLKSGAYIVIEYTEALTVIDVNSGKAIAGKSTNAETFMKINIEAAREIADQLRLRNLSGIIIVDFIEIPKTKEKELINAMEEFLKEDNTKSNVADMTKLGLMELTRRRTGKPIHELLIDNRTKM